MAIQIDPEFKALIPPLSSEEYTQLEQNLIKESNPDSIVLFTWNGVLIDGHNRYEICQKHNISFKTAEKNGFADRDDVKVWIINNQLGRRNIPQFVKIDLASKKHDILDLKEWAKQRMVEASHPKRDNNVAFQNSEKQPRKEINKVNITKKIAEETKLSTDTVSRGLQIIKNAPEEMKEKLRKGEASINEVYKEIKKEEKEEARKEEIAQLKFEIEQTPEPPDGKYDVIVVDPPWQYGTEYDPNGRRVASPYPEMSLEELSNLQIPASDDSILWLWTTHKFMRHSFELLDKWGFQDKVILTWVKDRIGIGSWLRSQTEFCIMAIKGNPKVILTNQSTVLNAPNREHSRKPDEFYKMVESLCVGRKLDYFSREKREGWTQYGNEPSRF